MGKDISAVEKLRRLKKQEIRLQSKIKETEALAKEEAERNEKYIVIGKKYVELFPDAQTDVLLESIENNKEFISNLIEETMNDKKGG